MDLLDSAIVKVRERVLPSTMPNGTFVPEDSYKRLYDSLDVWGKDRNDPDMEEKAKYIYDYLGGDYENRLVSVLTKIGPLAPMERKIDRIYKFCKLKTTANQLKAHWRQVKSEIESLGKKCT